MKPRKTKSSGELEQYIAELKEQIKQAQLDKREALAREQKQAREWRTALTQEIGATLLTVTGCDWTRLDLDALREWLLDHAGEMQTLLVGPEPVSYTHLDVYKRQPQRPPPASLR